MSSGSSPAPLYLWVIYEDPRDYPNRFVVRRWVCGFGSIALKQATPDPEPTAVVFTLEQARAAIPAGAVNLGRYANDDPAIREVWM